MGSTVKVVRVGGKIPHVHDILSQEAIDFYNQIRGSLVGQTFKVFTTWPDVVRLTVNIPNTSHVYKSDIIKTMDFFNDELEPD